MMKRATLFLGSLLLVGSLLGLAGCGLTSSAHPGASASPSVSDAPDNVLIAIDSPAVAPDKPVVTLTDVTLVRQLYAAIIALPPMPARVACTSELGPHYSLTVRRGSQTLLTALARREGCSPVTLGGESRDRRASQAFWSQLDEAIYAATPLAHPTGLAIEHVSDPAGPPQTALISSAEVAQRLYTAILALKQIPWATGCADAPIPEYQLAFQAANATIPAVIHTSCNSIDLQGGFRTRGGSYVMDTQFMQLFQRIIGGATFLPSSPDRLTLSVARAFTSGQQITVTDTGLMRRLYQAAFALPAAQPQPGCPPEADKLAGKGTWYTFSFSQWGLPLLQLEAYEGSCTRVSYPLRQRVAQGDQAFWTLVHQAAGQN